jgi:hypothetical protein
VTKVVRDSEEFSVETTEASVLELEEIAMGAREALELAAPLSVTLPAELDEI